MSRYALAILVVLAFAATAASQPIPAFEQYRVKPRQIETPAQPVLKKEFQENTVWRDAIIEAAKAPANFTGQYSMISVSYTHLDVYKRQLPHGAFSLASRVGSPSGWSPMPTSGCADREGSLPSGRFR